MEGNQPPVEDSELAVETLSLPAGEMLECSRSEHDTVVLLLPPSSEQGTAALTLAGEESAARTLGGFCLRATIGPGVDRHAPMGERERIVGTGQESQSATGKRTFEILYGPHNGCLGATLFVGYVPPGAAPWHFHLYDEIVWIWRGEGRFHTRAGSEALGPGSAFRIRPREVHVVENTSATDELVVVGLFTPAGSPSAAYLADDTDIPYAIEAA